MNFRKPSHQQEMVQVDRSDNTSPFWRTASANSQRDSNNASKQPPTPERKVIGASYSHADILKLDNLNVSDTSSRPRTPPYLPRQNSTPSPRSAGGVTSPPTRRTNTSSLSDANTTWSATGNSRDETPQVGFDEDEDEFGLPSLASMRRRDTRGPNKRSQDAGGSRSNLPSANNSTSALASWSLDNGDVADTRTIPSYPTAKKSEGKILRPQYKDILRDPANSLHLISHPAAPPFASAKELEAHSARTTRINKFKKILQASAINLPELRDSAWSGLPSEVRAMSWQILLGYLPTSSERRVTTLERKRREYLEGVRQAFERGTAGSDKAVDAGIAGAGSAPYTKGGKGRGLDEAIWHQISIDVPRTSPHLELYSYEATQRSLERILYVWAIRHPASGYVQGINDLVTPFWQVFLGQYITDPDVASGMDPGQLPKPVLDAVEADTFWSLTKLLDGIQDNYIHAQPGIQRQVAALRDLTARIDGPLAKHMESEGIEFIQFSFRWMNCLLMRELSVKNVIRMWDTYLSESEGFTTFHLYVCAAFLVKWSAKLQRMDFQEIMMFLQSLPTRDWDVGDVELLLSEAFIWQSLFSGTRAHVPVQKAGDGGLNL